MRLLAACAALLAGSGFAQPALDLKTLDRSADPCADFYQFACGGWLRANPIPADQARWSRFDELQQRNQTVLKAILEAAAEPRENRGPLVRLTGDYYAACMNEPEIERSGLAPLQAVRERIDGLKTAADVPAEIVRLHRAGIMVFFQYGSAQDFQDSTRVIAEIDQGGLGLPDRDYYFKTDAKSQEILQRYRDHVARMFELAGAAREEAAAKSRAVLRIESALALAALDRVARRDPAKLYHPMPVAEAAKLIPALGLSAYLAGTGTPPAAQLNVVVPEFLRAVDKTLRETPLPDLKTYLHWNLLRDSAGLLPKRFDDESFSFYGRILTGAKEQQPRWKRCVNLADQQLGEALGQLYVERAFAGQSRERMRGLVAALEAALEKDIRELPWMSEATRKQALEKLRAIVNKVGHPEKWIDYSRLAISRTNALANYERGNRFEHDRDLAKIGRPADKSEWSMTPPTVNAYYDAQNNTINFPAGILQPPFFDGAGDDALNFGGIGAVIGHELTHGFDDEGRQFDAQGNLRDWWTPADAAQFEQRAACIEKQYAAYPATATEKLNGKLTLGENVADNGGLRIALRALLATAGSRKDRIEGFTPEQRFFLGWARVWCENQTEESARLRQQVDPHAPGRYRVNGVLSNMPEFREAFACKANQPMVSGAACRVW